MSKSSSDIFVSQQAVFGAGCFWGVQYYFDQVTGVISTLVGYTGGRVSDPTYAMVCNTDTGHAEAVWIEFNPGIVSFQTLLRHFFRMHDPTQVGGQGPDIGSQYRSAIFYQNDEQKHQAEEMIREITSSYQKPIATRLAYGREFWQAEDYHQKFTERTGRGACHVDYADIVDDYI